MSEDRNILHYLEKGILNLKDFNEIFLFCLTHANLHNVIAAITRGTVALKIAGCISASAVTANTTHDFAFVDICTEFKV